MSVRMRCVAAVLLTVITMTAVTLYEIHVARQMEITETVSANICMARLSLVRMAATELLDEHGRCDRASIVKYLSEQMNMLETVYEQMRCPVSGRDYHIANVTAANAPALVAWDSKPSHAIHDTCTGRRIARGGVFVVGNRVWQSPHLLSPTDLNALLSIQDGR